MSAKRRRRSHGRARVAARRARLAATVQHGGPLGWRVRAAHSQLLIVDMQERVVPAVHAAGPVLTRVEWLLRAARALQVPVLLTAHCPERLGPVVPALSALVEPHETFVKSHFCAADEPAVAQRLALHRRPQVIVAGVEAHVCVLQTALALAERGYRPHVVIDASGSREELSRTVACERLRTASIPVLTTEMVLFEWLEHAERPELRDILAWIR